MTMKISRGDRRDLSGPSTESYSCTLGPDGEITARVLDHIEYHRGGPKGEPVFVVGEHPDGGDVLITGVRDLTDLREAIERSGRVKPKAISVGAEAEPVVVDVVRTR